MACVCAFRTSSSIDTASGLTRTLPRQCSEMGCTGVFSKPPTRAQCSTYVPAPTNSDYSVFFRRMPMAEGIDVMVSCSDRSAPAKAQPAISAGVLAATHERVNRMLEDIRLPQRKPAMAFALANE